MDGLVMALGIVALALAIVALFIQLLPFILIIFDLIGDMCYNIKEWISWKIYVWKDERKKKKGE